MSFEFETKPLRTKFLLFQRLSFVVAVLKEMPLKETLKSFAFSVTKRFVAKNQISIEK
jgi:hypothetical protein